MTPSPPGRRSRRIGQKKLSYAYKISTTRSAYHAPGLGGATPDPAGHCVSLPPTQFLHTVSPSARGHLWDTPRSGSEARSVRAFTAAPGATKGQRRRAETASEASERRRTNGAHPGPDALLYHSGPGSGFVFQYFWGTPTLGARAVDTGTIANSIPAPGPRRRVRVRHDATDGSRQLARSRLSPPRLKGSGSGSLVRGPKNKYYTTGALLQART